MARWLPLLLSMALIFVMSMNHDPYKTLPSALRQPVHVAQTTYQEEELFSIPGHIIEYVLLGVTAANAFVRRKHRSIMAFILVFIGCQIYALSDEFHQLFVPGRAFELSDLGLDAIGILAGLLLYWYATKKLRKAESHG
jgi:VanZ family protein